ncbi:MAG: hypothetical protein ACRCT6_02025, partial [Notoacmeibacter sp.]
MKLLKCCIAPAPFYQLGKSVSAGTAALRLKSGVAALVLAPSLLSLCVGPGLASDGFSISVDGEQIAGDAAPNPVRPDLDNSAKRTDKALEQADIRI